MKSNQTQKLKKIIKAILRLFFLFLAFYWFFTKYEDYYYYNDINWAANHAEVECGRNRKKTLRELDDCILEQFTKKHGCGTSTGYKEQRDQKLQELDQLQKDIIRLASRSKQSVYEKDELTRKQDKYQRDLKNLRDSIITNIKHLRGRAAMAELDSRRWWEVMRSDPTHFFLLRPLNWASQNLKNHLWAEMLFKFAVIKLILLLVLYPQEQQISDNQQLESVIRKKPFSLIEQIINVIIYIYLALRVLFAHPYAFDRLHPAFLRQINIWEVIGFILLRSLFGLVENLACRREMSTKKSLRKYLWETWLPQTSLTLLGFLAFSPWFLRESQGTSLLFAFGSLVDSLGNILVCYIKPKKPARQYLATK